MATNKFKVGQKLRVVTAAGTPWKVGDVVTVTDVWTKEPQYARVVVNGDNNTGSGWNEMRFELVVEAPAFKVGDKVRIVCVVKDRDPDGMGVGQKWENSWSGRMNDYVGDGASYTVNRITSSGVYMTGTGHYGWPATALELAVETDDFADTNGVDDSGKKAKFVTADLKPFQRVVTRNGTKGVVTYAGNCDELRITTDGGSYAARFDHAKEGLGVTNDFDIVEVYEAPSNPFYALTVNERGNLLFRAVDFAEQKRKKAAAEKAVADAKAALAVAEAAAAALN